MIGTRTSNGRNNISRILFVLGVLLYLTKGQGALFVSPGCSADPVVTTVELVLTDLPDHTFHFQPPTVLTPDAGSVSAEYPLHSRSDYTLLSIQHDTHARLVLKSNEIVSSRLPQSGIAASTRRILPQSSDVDPSRPLDSTLSGNSIR